MQHITLTFSGRAKELEADQSEIPDKLLRREIVPMLNRRRQRICHDIAEAISAQLPPGCRVTVDIAFRSGSIVWDGIVGVITTMGLIGGAAEFTEYLVRGIRLAVTSVVRDHVDHTLPHPMPDMDMETVVEPAITPAARQSYALTPPAHSQALGSRVLFVSLAFLILNAVLLFWVLIFLYARFPIKTP